MYLYNKVTDGQILKNLFEFEYAIRNECNGYSIDPDGFRAWREALNWTLTGYCWPNDIAEDRGDFWIFEDKYSDWKKLEELEGD